MFLQFLGKRACKQAQAKRPSLLIVLFATTL
jgi:hypothetical protein